MTTSVRTLVSRVALALLLAAAASSSVEAQTLRGRTLDGANEMALPGVRVSLVHPDGTILKETLSGENGGFVLTADSAGDYYLKAELNRYEILFDGIFELGENGLLEVSLYMRPAPILLEGITAEVQQQAQERRRLRAQGFYQRAATGFGRFIGPEDIERRPTFTFGDILRGIPGITFSGDNIQFRASSPTGSGNCSPNVYIDGALQFGGVPLGAIIQPSDVAGVEVYRRVSETPLMWGGTNGSCGTILVWTKGGR